MKMYRILGQRGRVTIPQEMRGRVGFRYNDILSFTETDDGRSVIVTREAVCDGCGDDEMYGAGADQEDIESGELTLTDLLDSLSPEQQRAALLHLSLRLTERDGGDRHV